MKKVLLMIGLVLGMASMTIVGCGKQTVQNQNKTSQETSMINQDVTEIQEIQWGEYEDGDSGQPWFLSDSEAQEEVGE